MVTEGVSSDEQGGVVGDLSQCVSISVGPPKRHEAWCCPDGRHVSTWPILEVFLRLHTLIGQTGKGLRTTSDFTEGAPYAQCPFNPTRFAALTS